MLNKNVCIKCINKRGKTRFVWDNKDELEWNAGGKVQCLLERKPISNLSIPSWCGYKLEHLLKDKRNAE
jgi:hypothetical protein